MNEKPDIVLIQSDQHKASVLGCAGDEYVRTPNIDALANDGVLFDNCYCNSPLCVPSRSSMLAGMLPSETQVYNNAQCLRSDKATFVHSLGSAGYETVLCGRMHFNGPDQNHGFEKRVGKDVTRCFPAQSISQNGLLQWTAGQGMKAVKKSGPGYSYVLQYDEYVLEQSRSYLENRENGRPLFLTVGFYGPHCPYVCPEDLYNYYFDILPELDECNDEFLQTLHPAVIKWMKNRGVYGLPGDDTRRIRAAYYGMVTYLDTLTGKLLEQIYSSLDPENTIVIYTSDHGDNIGENGLFWKSNFYDGAAKVPLIFNFPKKFQKGKREPGLSCLLDIAPTLIEICDAPGLPKMQGISLLPVVDGEGVIAPDRAVIGQLAENKKNAPSAMIRKGDWKLVNHFSYEYPQLFNLKKDPKERNDLGKNQAYKQVKEALLQELSYYWDGEEQYEKMKEDTAHMEFLDKWARKINYTSNLQWVGQSERNYVTNTELK